MNIPKDYLQLEARENALKKVSELLSRHPDGIPLDPEVDMKIRRSSYKTTVRRLEALENLFEKHKIAKSPLIAQKLKVLHMKEELTAKIRSLKKTVRSSTALAFKDELKARKRVLRRLGYITSDNVVELKGKVACEISSAEELTLTELMFSGIRKQRWKSWFLSSLALCGERGYLRQLNPEKNSIYSSYSYKTQPGVSLNVSLGARSILT